MKQTPKRPEADCNGTGSSLRSTMQPLKTVVPKNQGEIGHTFDAENVEPFSFYCIFARTLYIFLRLTPMVSRIKQLLGLFLVLLAAACGQETDRTGTAEAYFRQGQALHRDFYLLRAADCYRQAARLAGQDSLMLFYINLELGRIHHYKSPDRTADSCLDNAWSIACHLHNDTLQAKARYEKARQLMRRKDLVAAKLCLQQALASTPEAEEVWEALARLYLTEGKPDSALACLQQAPAQPSRHRLMAEAFLLLGKTDSAAHYLSPDTSGLTLREQARLSRDLARLDEQRGHLAQALEYLKRHVALRDSIENDRREEIKEKVNNAYEYHLQRQRADKAEQERDREKLTVYQLLSTALALLFGMTILYIRTKRRQVRTGRRLQKERLQTMQAELRRKETETALAREQETRKRQELETVQRKLDYYKSLNAITIPILESRQNALGSLHLAEEDWTTVVRNTDACFDRFTERLRRHCPQLTEDDLRFCCLVKMQLSLSLLAAIYHIAKGSISRRKMRLKEKLQITDETFDEFIARF